MFTNQFNVSTKAKEEEENLKKDAQGRKSEFSDTREIISFVRNEWESTVICQENI